MFVHTDEQAQTLRTSPLRDTWADTYYEIAKPHDEFGYLDRAEIAIMVDSKENFETNDAGNWYYYFQVATWSERCRRGVTKIGFATSAAAQRRRAAGRELSTRHSDGSHTAIRFVQQVRLPFLDLGMTWSMVKANRRSSRRSTGHAP